MAEREGPAMPGTRRRPAAELDGLGNPREKARARHYAAVLGGRTFVLSTPRPCAVGAWFKKLHEGWPDEDASHAVVFLGPDDPRPGPDFQAGGWRLAAIAPCREITQGELATIRATKKAEDQAWSADYHAGKDPLVDWLASSEVHSARSVMHRFILTELARASKG